MTITKTEILKKLAAKGWEVRRWPPWIKIAAIRERSFTLPYRKIVFISDLLGENTYGYLRVLIHETKHIEQSETVPFFVLSYLLFPNVRLRLEFEAIAHSDKLLNVSSSTALKFFDNGKVGRNLIGFRFPYFTCASKAHARKVYKEELAKAYAQD